MNDPPPPFYWKLGLLATLGGFLFGYDTSNIGSALNFVPYGLHGLALGYLVSGASLGAAAGAILAGPIADRYGPKWLLITDAAIYALGSILSSVTPDAAVLLVARTLIGLAIGADSAIATAYIAEFAPKNRRGSLALLQQWMITVGILIAYIIALIIFALWPASAPPPAGGWCSAWAPFPPYLDSGYAPRYRNHPAGCSSTVATSMPALLWPRSARATSPSSRSAPRRPTLTRPRRPRRAAVGGPGPQGSGVR